MKLVELTEIIVKELVSDPDSISVKEFPSENENEIIIQVMVSNDEMGKVIGKQGRIAKSIRTVMKAIASKDKKRIVIKFVE